MYACGGGPHFWKRGEKKEIIWAYMEKMLFRQKMMLLCGLDDSLMNSINEECIHQTNSRLDLQLVQDCTSWPSVIPRDTESSTQKNSDSSKVLGSMIDLKRLNKRTRWNDVRRGIFRPEPNYDPDEFWLEVHPLSDFICESCSAAVEHGDVWNTNTECYRSCLNCAANWNRMSSYENHDPFFNEHEVDAHVAARLINIYNTSWDWREVTATQDLKAFMVTAALSMVSAYRTSGDVLKQVSHRGAIRLPVKMIKGKCKRNLLGQFAVQRETIVDVDERNMTTTRWFYRLTWDGGNVAYHDYVKTVLMPNPPKKRDDLPIEISSDEEEEETGDFVPTAEEAPTETDDEEMEDDDKPFEEGDANMGGDDEEQDDDEPQNEAKRRRKGIRGLFEQFEGLVETCEYSNPTYMNEIGDRADGGEYLVNDVDISRGGPADWGEMELLIERASSEAPPIVSSVKDYVEGKVGYRQPADSDEAMHKYAAIRLYTIPMVWTLDA
eukprot:s1851_g30.t1